MKLALPAPGKRQWLLLGAAAIALLMAALLATLPNSDRPLPRSRTGLTAVPVEGRQPASELTAGRFLVSYRNLPDPNFAETVVLLARYDRQEGAMGVIVNRRTKLPLAKVLDGFEAAREREDPVYLGGPVAPYGVVALLYSARKPDGADHIFDSVYLITDAGLLEELIASGRDAAELRVYLGYAGWAPGQLEGEVALETWHVFKSDAAAVFDPAPETLWERFIGRTELRIALLARLAIPPAASRRSAW